MKPHTDIAAVNFPIRSDPPGLEVQGTSLRHACPNDIAFLLALYASFRSDELAAVPWSPEQKQAFLEQQFFAQHRHYRSVYPEADYLVVEIGDKPVGRLYLDAVKERWLIVDIGFLPEWRRQGKGTALLTAIQREATTSEACVLTLHVEQRNCRAQALYQRLGFRGINDVGSHIKMEWSPGDSDGAKRR
jgi:ribosomal protein S18 acetylase RimI-like enzyme